MTQLMATVLSVVLELPVVMSLGWYLSEAPKPRLWALAALGAAATLVTHPFAWAAILKLTPEWGYPAAVIVTEAAVVAIEGMIYAVMLGLGPARGLSVSLVANATSVAGGYLVWWALEP